MRGDPGAFLPNPRNASDSEHSDGRKKIDVALLNFFLGEAGIRMFFSGIRLHMAALAYSTNWPECVIRLQVFMPRKSKADGNQPLFLAGP